MIEIFSIFSYNSVAKVKKLILATKILKKGFFNANSKRYRQFRNKR